MNRRRFVRTAVGELVSAVASRGAVAKDKVRLGFIGVGGHGNSHVHHVLRFDHVEVPHAATIAS